MPPVSPQPNRSAKMEFHVSRLARDWYQFDQELFAFSGNVLIANFRAAQIFAQKMNQRRDLINHPEQAVSAGQINAMGIIDEILHAVISSYRREINPKLLSEALDWLSKQVGEPELEIALHEFSQEFPPLVVYRGDIDVGEYLKGATGGVPHREVALEEMILLWLANANPAFSPYRELFDDSRLAQRTAYRTMITGLHNFFDSQPSYGPEKQNLLDLLRAPALASPDSLTGQLAFLRTRWSAMIGSFLFRMLTSLDLIKEEEKPTFLGPGPAVVYEYIGQEFEPEQFSPDRDWMPSVVLIAKNSYVWLDQLSKKYQHPILTLDQIPDQELDALARSGITGLWLIGLWERSPASQRIKQLRGNPEAVASAYSLFSYEIASDLGGDAAYEVLRRNAWKRGIRLASDMVPNHMGIDSRWVIEHPNWFISLDYSPFPSYSFNGPNLSWDSRVGIFLEDHYYNNSDAAVVFKRVDFWTGQEKYIYHGNDGTSFPWNDTAQLDYLNPEVREAVIQTILHVARKFPIIRFDAAMTLAKKHFQRLWYPEPGSGGDIPSRSEHGLIREQFDAALPVEFWREVVDRVAQEVPDTLLLAEAFWLMEGYFVRTLGMHRVYNSAFMNMLRDEKNQEYRLVIKNTVEFDPEILKRYVNFMNNPDEKTAVEQFGKGDKYFGICTMMATLPGLPMFGHGQIEGFTEKYGMEYRKAYWDEQVDGYLVERHQRQIFPLLRKRYIFAEARDFMLYDFYSSDSIVNEDVFAYSNRWEGERALVLYHNKFATAKGWITVSAAHPVKTGEGDEKTLVQTTLGEALELNHSSNTYTIFRDYVTGQEYIRSNQELLEQGLYVELDAYECHVFLDFREVQDDAEGRYANLVGLLEGRGVSSIEDALKEHTLRSVLLPFTELVNAGQYQWLIDHRLGSTSHKPSDLPPVLDEVESKVARLQEEINNFLGNEVKAAQLADRLRLEVGALLALTQPEGLFPEPLNTKARSAIKLLQSSPVGTSLRAFEAGSLLVWGVLLSWIMTHRLGELSGVIDSADVSRKWFDEWLLSKRVEKALRELGLDAPAANRAVSAVRLMLTHQNWIRHVRKGGRGAIRSAAGLALKEWLADAAVQRFIGFNHYQDLIYYNKESFEEWLWWNYTAATVVICAESTGTERSARMLAVYDVISALLKAEAASGYQVDALSKSFD